MDDDDSSTRAMKDTYTRHSNTLEEYMRSFNLTPDQQGSLVFINGKPVGFDLVSRSDKYAVIHPQLMRSYALEAMLEQTNNSPAPNPERAMRFIEAIGTCKTSPFDSVGLGVDIRVESKKLVGSALAYEDQVVHLCLFAAEEEAVDMHMTQLRQRRRFRRNG